MEIWALAQTRGTRWKKKKRKLKWKRIRQNAYKEHIPNNPSSSTLRNRELSVHQWHLRNLWTNKQTVYLPHKLCNEADLSDLQPSHTKLLPFPDKIFCPTKSNLIYWQLYPRWTQVNGCQVEGNNRVIHFWKHIFLAYRLLYASPSVPHALTRGA